jgi:hypothetical protein
MRAMRGAALAAVVAGMLALGVMGTVPIAIAQDYTVDSAASETLTDYLRHHRLPLVGAQVGTAPAGARRLVLYGYVATPFGKRDAESKALAFVGAPHPTIVNRIVIKPELANMKSGTRKAGSHSISRDDSQASGVGDYTAARGGGAFAGESINQVLDDIQRYGIKSPPQDPGMR